jgi:hypothetical protein
MEPKLFDGVIDGVRSGVTTVADDLRSLQTGFLREYALVFFLCAAVGLIVLGFRLA